MNASREVGNYASLHHLLNEMISADNCLVAVVFDAEELWTICRASDHVPGADIPVLAARQSTDVTAENAEVSSDCTFNMILPLAYTPMLMALYIERGRLFQSAINVTG